LGIQEREFGSKHPSLARTLNALGIAYGALGKTDRAIAAFERSFGMGGEDDLGWGLSNLAQLYLAQSRYDEAAKLLERRLALLEQTLGAGHQQVAYALLILARVYAFQHRDAEEESLVKRAVMIADRFPGMLVNDEIYNDMANIQEKKGNMTSAVMFSRKAARAVTKYDEAFSAAWAGIPKSDPRLARKDIHAADFDALALLLRLHVARLAAAVRAGAEPEGKLGREALLYVQRAWQSSTAAALQSFAARIASADSALATLVREDQDLAAAWREQDKKLANAIAQGQNDRVAIEAMRAKATLDRRRRYPRLDPA
jgi:hypothetical protein